jgi:histidinol dehydrogenase
MQVIKYPPRQDWPKYIERSATRLKKTRKIVKPIMKKVKRNGDSALIKFALEFDLVHLEDLAVTEQERVSAAQHVSSELKNAIQQARHNIEAFHMAQRQEVLELETMPGITCRRRSVPIERVGLYIPGGTAPLFSTVLMLGVPARLAGCQHIILCTPPNRTGDVDPAILYTADLLGITKIYKTGGAQAIAAFMYGTESIPKVDKIFGPGNQYVTAAKLEAAKRGIAIDMPAGPSEVAVYADSSANPAFIASDLLSQAEHGADSQAILVTTEESLIDQVKTELEKQLEVLDRKEQALQALESSRFILLEYKSLAMEFINEYAAEHLIIATDDAERLAEKVTNAGSVFLGHYSPESVGDYASGTNHTLPTTGFARSYSGVSLDSFVKKITFQQLTAQGLKNIGDTVKIMAEAEHLQAHANAVDIRLKTLGANEK